MHPKKWAGELEVKRLAEAGVNPFVVRDAFSQGLRLNFSKKYFRFSYTQFFIFNFIALIKFLTRAVHLDQLDWIGQAKAILTRDWTTDMHLKVI